MPFPKDTPLPDRDRSTAFVEFEMMDFVIEGRRIGRVVQVESD